MLGKFTLACAAGVLVTGVAGAQTNVQWVTFTKQPSKLLVAPTALTDANTQIFFKAADLDKDGWNDIIGVRKEQAALLGKRASFLLMNENGFLTDRTALYGSAVLDVPGDLGMLQPANNREVFIADFDGDTWLDAITATTLSDGDPKHISHPRVFMNLGDDVNGDWLGMRFENARIPQLKTVGGLSVAPRFCGIALGDFDVDGDPDVYMVDYDGTETFISEPSNWDLNDRYFENDGNGFFTDTSAAHFTSTQLLSAFGADCHAVDLNNDGFLDIGKDTTLGNPQKVRAFYNDPANPGEFAASGLHDFGSSQPYGIDFGNINNDEWVDLVIADDGSDRIRYGTGLDALNKMVWGPLKTFQFVTGADDGFGHTPYIKDLDGNGWNDVLITDVDGDVPGCGRRLHIYHNLGTIPGDMNTNLKEESELANGGTGAGWKGVVGMTAADAKGTFDTLLEDFDHDGDIDMLVGTCSGTTYYQNELNPVQEVCQTDVGNGGPGSMVLSMCGDDLTQAASISTLSLTGAVPLSPMYMPLSLSSTPTPFKGGTLVPFPSFLIVFLATDGAGSFTAPVPGAGGPSFHFWMQCLVKNGSVWEFSNGLDVLIGS